MWRSTHFRSIAIAAAGVVLTINSSDVRADPSLTFAQSPQTSAHVTLQPQRDYHRVHFLVQAVDLRDIPCEAVLVCTESGINRPDNPISRSVVYFTPDKDNQTFSVHMRTPKITDRSVHYYLWVEVSKPWNQVSPAGSTAYHWQVHRDERGAGRVIGQPPGTDEEIVQTFAIPIKDESDGEVRIRIVFQARSQTISVPAGFVFRIDNSATYRNHASVEPLN